MRALATGARLWWGLPVLFILLATAGALALVDFPGLPQPPALTPWVLPAARFARDVTSVLTVGSVVVGGLLLPTPSRRVLRWAAGWAGAWLASLAVLLAFTVCDVLAVGLRQALSPSTFGPFVLDLVVGRVFLAQAILVAAVVVLAIAVPGRTGRWVMAALVVAAAAAPAFLGHGGLSGAHAAATVSLGLHIAAVSLWVGGLAVVVAALAVEPRAASTLLPRFSLMALWCVIVTAETGLLNASLRVGTATALVGTFYGALVIGKALLLGVLVRLGWLQRRRSLARLDRDLSIPRLARIAGVEMVAMGVAIGVSVALARIGPGTPSPTGQEFLPLSVVLLALAAPLLAAVTLPVPRSRALARLADYPEVPAVLLLVAVAEVTGIGVVRGLVGQQASVVVGMAVLALAGWLWAISTLRSRTPSGVIIVMACWPLVMWFAASRAGQPAGWRIEALSLVLAETLLVAVLVRDLLARAVARRPVAEPSVLAV